MQKQKPTARMVLRTQALIALRKAILPGFCEDMVCDHTCPFYINVPGNEPCIWIKTYNAIDRMACVLEKDKLNDEIEFED